MEGLEFVQRIEYLVKDKSHVEGNIAFQVYHTESERLVLSVKQCSDYLDNSKVVHDTSGRKLLKMRRDQGLSVMPMYIHDYRTKTEYRWKSQDVQPYNKKSKSNKKEKNRKEGHGAEIIYSENIDEMEAGNNNMNRDEINNNNDNSSNNEHRMTIATSVDKSSFEIMEKETSETVAFVRVHEQVEVGVCSYNVSANSDVDLPFIITLVISVDERYMGMARLKGSPISTGLCTIQ